ncbi:hypothetical protein [Micromonospora sp. CPCC 205561]|uniref:hypothetical protein n=1 Tax=Micromonospora sp. CPCC 205561 TaxID=3122407 RepID=UPI002FF2AE6C
MIDSSRTTANLLQRVALGDMVLLRADCPLERTTAIFESETRYTLRHYLGCRVCDRTILYGLCVRGLPIYRHVDADEPVTVRWERSETFVDHLGGIVDWFEPRRAG